MFQFLCALRASAVKIGVGPGVALYPACPYLFFVQGLRVASAVALTLSLLACGGGTEGRTDALDSSLPDLSRISLLRLPRRGGEARLYSALSLKRLEWRPRGRLPALERAVGADLDQRLAFALGAKGGIAVIDLETGTIRTAADGAAVASLGPDRTLWTVDGDGEVTALVRRISRPVAGRTPARPALFGTGSGQLVALGSSEGPRAVLLGGPEEGTTADLPPGPVAATQWGDLVAVAADTAVVLWNPATGDVGSVRMRRGAKAVGFSPSGHRLYVLNDAPRLQVLDRESEATLGTVDLPDTARAIRPDPLGAYLLVRAASGDAVWVVDPASLAVRGTVRTEWASDLPTIVGSRFLLHREDGDLVALDLERDSLPEAGRIEGGGADLWLALDWSPRRRDGAPEEPEEALAEAAADAPAVPADTTAPAAPATTLYLQLSSSRNPAWANDLAQQLRGAGVAALVLPAGDSLYRVVVGPFGTREEAEAAARNLGRPSFILEQGSAE